MEDFKDLKDPMEVKYKGQPGFVVDVSTISKNGVVNPEFKLYKKEGDKITEVADAKSTDVTTNVFTNGNNKEVNLDKYVDKHLRNRATEKAGDKAEKDANDGKNEFANEFIKKATNTVDAATEAAKLMAGKKLTANEIELGSALIAHYSKDLNFSKEDLKNFTKVVDVLAKNDVTQESVKNGGKDINVKDLGNLQSIAQQASVDIKDLKEASKLVKQ